MAGIYIEIVEVNLIDAYNSTGNIDGDFRKTGIRSPLVRHTKKYNAYGGIQYRSATLYHVCENESLYGTA
jgi:hypothetical protein